VEEGENRIGGVSRFAVYEQPCGEEDHQHLPEGGGFHSGLRRQFVVRACAVKQRQHGGQERPGRRAAEDAARVQALNDETVAQPCRHDAGRHARV